jgi:cytochrome c oxidase assembly protein Cox11
MAKSRQNTVQRLELDFEEQQDNFKVLQGENKQVLYKTSTNTSAKNKETLSTRNKQVKELEKKIKPLPKPKVFIQVMEWGHLGF